MAAGLQWTLPLHIILFSCSRSCLSHWGGLPVLQPEEDLKDHKIPVVLDHEQRFGLLLLALGSTTVVLIPRLQPELLYSKKPIIVLGLCGCFSSCSLFFDLLLKVDPGDGKDFLLYIWTFSAQTEQITADKKFLFSIILRLKCNHKCKRSPGAGSDARRWETT